MIEVKAYHGMISTRLANKMDKIAKLGESEFKWDFEGTVGDFADKWQNNFLALCDKGVWKIFITDRQTFGNYG